jgi:TolB-like protein
MLAVLPFDNLTGDAAQDYFSDGFTEEMKAAVCATGRGGERCARNS